MSLVSKALAAVVAILWGASMIVAGTLGIKPGTDIATMTVGIGVILILLSVDQLWRSTRSLN